MIGIPTPKVWPSFSKRLMCTGVPEPCLGVGEPDAALPDDDPDGGALDDAPLVHPARTAATSRAINTGAHRVAPAVRTCARTVPPLPGDSGVPAGPRTQPLPFPAGQLDPPVRPGGRGPS